MTTQDLASKLETMRSLAYELEMEYRTRTAQLDRLDDNEIDYHAARKYAMLQESKNAFKMISNLLAFNAHAIEL